MPRRVLKIAVVSVFALLTASMTYLWVIGTLAMITAGAWGEGALFTCMSGWLTIELAVQLKATIEWDFRR